MEIGGWQHFIYFSFYHFNPQKCKEMVVNFMGNPNTMMRPLHIGNQMVERISSYNLLALMRTGNGTAMLTILPLRHQRNFTLSDY